MRRQWQKAVGAFDSWREQSQPQLHFCTIRSESECTSFKLGVYELACMF